MTTFDQSVSATQIQTASLARIVAYLKTLTVTQTQVPSVVIPKTIHQAISVTQVQV